ncbi:hypothetical protein HU200_050920 [Digitaria exilis]|uniref:CRIB domain-containing protein n=1 Tax=Digitaria exilis TaxID=1010633 RepID=A0A835A0K2_9POAL|nr:hypothetical protein HU200_066213 [Digitaria exilis]KAF8670104.1 hypothetical protein HU200_050920 [Digitaria exilis]CAB3489779.1 unnamed protein product [Digitaria exilis]
MTLISEQLLPKPNELGAQAATSHNAPAAPNEEAIIGDTENANQEEQRQQAARRERDFLAGIRKLIKSFKSLSHIFEIYKDDDEDEDDMDGGIEIGFPTDVQHVAHIGLDGSTSVSSSLRGLEGARELLSLSNLTTLE